MTRAATLKKRFHKRSSRYTWIHGAVFLAGVTLLERGLEYFAKQVNPRLHTDAEDGDYYRSLKQPLFAPPAKAFPIAWALCDLVLVWGNLRVLNKPANAAGRKEYLRLQAASWSVYSLFTAMHFGLRSPINAFALTTLHTGLTTASGVVALTRLKDKQVALSLAPVLGWLCLALPTATTTAWWNKDRLYQKGPFASPPQQWLK